MCEIEFDQIIPVRALVAILIFFGSFVSYMLRVDISVVVLNISEISNYSILNDPNCFDNESKSLRMYGMRMIHNATIAWKPLNPIMVATLFSTYNWGYSFSILLAEPLAEKIGVARIIGYSTLVAACLTLLCPVAYFAGVFVLIAARFLIGFFSGFVFPLLHILIQKWSPMRERNKFALSLYGTSLGMITTFPLCACIMHHWSWEWITYILGTFAVIWSIMWLNFVTDLPIQHAYISSEELRVIEFRRISLVTRRRRKKVPWYKILQTAPIWALFMLLWGNTWNLSFYLDYMPLYYHAVLGYDVVSGSALASMPILARMVFSLLCMPLAQCFATRQYFSTVGNVRKCFTFLSHILPAVIQLALVNLTFCNRLASTIIPIVVLGLNGAIIGGGSLNTADLTPHFAANVYNAMQTILCFAGIIMPYVVALILMHFKNHINGWIVVLAVNACIYLVGGVIFLIFGSGRVQRWDVTSVRGAVFRGLVADDEENNWDEDLEMH